MTPCAERPNTVTRDFILARCTNVQWVTPEFAGEMVQHWSFMAESPVISERDGRVYRLIAEMFEARAKEVV
jgi:hypothetical protein